MDSNKFITDPLRVYIYNPITNSVIHTVVFINAPKHISAAIDKRNEKQLKEFFGRDWRTKLAMDVTGGDYEDELDIGDIEQLLKSTETDIGIEHKPQVKQTMGWAKPVEYITDVKIYPEDKFSELKDKIFIAAGIPTYRQHLFYMDKNRVDTTYKLYAGGLYDTNIKTISSPSNILGVPIDKNLYDLRDEIRIESQEEFRLIGDYIDNSIYITDMALFTGPILMQLEELLSDSYMTELFYHGFVLKYWPALTQECFYDYVINENEMKLKYPDLAKDKLSLTQKYVIESGIIDYDYKNISRALNLAESINITTAITQMTAVVNTQRVLINVRNLFDKLRVTRCVPEIHAYIDHNNKQYLLRKRHIKNASDIPFPTNISLKTGVIIAISLVKEDQDTFHARSTLSTAENEQSRYIFLNIQPNGKYLIKVIWGEEDEFTFEQSLRIIKKFVDPIITGVNNLGKYVFIEGKELPILTKHNIVYQSLNMCMFWKKVMLEGAFKVVKSLWEPYLRAGITAPRNVQQFDKYEFLFCKGMHDFDPNIIEKIIAASHNVVLTNYYAHLSNNSIKQKWDQNYAGRTVRMYHRTTDIKIEVLSIREGEFSLFYRYILMFIYRAVNSEKVQSMMSVSKSYKDVKKLRKLREQDPELYNVKKYGSKKTYSILCQKSRQPIIYTQDELKNMPQTEVKKLTAYWNFTLNKPAFYGCPSKRFPHLTFIVDKHPKHYCLPCCGQASTTEDSKKNRINKICLSKHKYMKTDDRTQSRHIMNYGKGVEAGRLSKLPNLLVKNLLFGTLEGSSVGYYIYGVPQHVPGINYVGIVYSIAESLGTNMHSLIKDLLGMMNRSNKDALFNTLLNGTISEYFYNIEDLMTTIRELFLENKMISKEYQRFTQWSELFLELFHILLSINIFVFIDESGKGELVDLFVNDVLASELLHANKLGDSVDAKYIVLIKKQNKYYPVFVIDPEKYIRSFEIKKKLYNYNDKIIELIIQMILLNAKNQHGVNLQYNLSVIEEFISNGDYAIIKKFINKQNLCYGVLLGPNDIYIPIGYSVHLPDAIPISFESFDHKQYTLDIDKLNEFIKSFNRFIKERYKLAGADNLFVYKLISPEQYIEIDGTICGYKSGNMFYYFNKFGELPELPILRLQFDPSEINKLIMSRARPQPDARSQRIGESLYNNYKYQLFVLEFINYLDKERNLGIRNEISKLITVTDFKGDLGGFVGALRKLLGGYKSDYNLIQSQLMTFYYGHMSKQTLQSDIENTVYEFDHITINILRSLPNNRVKEELKKIVGNFAVEGTIDTSTITFPNIYLPCAEVTNDYCKDKRLILNEPLDTYIDILSADIKDELRSKYIMSGIFSDTTLRYLQFMSVPTEIITIYRLVE